MPFRIQPHHAALILGILFIAAALLMLTRLVGGKEQPAHQALTRSAETTPEPAAGLSAVPLSAALQPTPGGNMRTHTVARGENLARIAARYAVPLTVLVNANNIADPNLLYVGQVLVIPEAGTTVDPVQTGSLHPIIPDNELIYGPTVRGNEWEQVVPEGSWLRSHQEEVEGWQLGGLAVVRLVAQRTRVNPRLLLAALEYQSGWVTQRDPVRKSAMLGLERAGHESLYRQLDWAANQLNLGYYGRSEAGRNSVVLADGTRLAYSADMNHATAGVQQWLAARTDTTRAAWLAATAPEGFRTTWEALFGDPFALADDSFWPAPATLIQPALRLPWPDGETWHLTSGPHGGWNSGSAWAALDFVPGGDRFGCYDSDAWLVAVADGVISRSDFGAVDLDLDGDGDSSTGWVIVYQHVATRNRISVGQRVRTGDRIGHPSCEGGYSTGTHLHIARLYNGRWISADSEPPFNLGGWTVRGVNSEYNGLLVRAGEVREAFAGRTGNNMITAGE